jgi:hypothetical protein
MAAVLSLPILRRINALDAVGVFALALAFMSFTSELLTVSCLFACLFTQALIFRIHFKFTKDRKKMNARIFLVIVLFVGILLLLV